MERPDIDLDAAHQLLRDAAEKQALHPREPSRTDDQKVGPCLFDKPDDGIRGDTLDDAGAIVQIVEVKALHEPSKFVSHRPELALGFLAGVFDRDTGTGHHLPGDRCTGMNKAHVGVFK
ncbi:MAG: hypothetical protein M5U35_10540 [Roseovarius sp.]|nr:hypothetical protein [Roseovarius sp.]